MEGVVAHVGRVSCALGGCALSAYWATRLWTNLCRLTSREAMYRRPASGAFAFAFAVAFAFAIASSFLALRLPEASRALAVALEAYNLNSRHPRAPCLLLSPRASRLGDRCPIIEAMDPRPASGVRHSILPSRNRRCSEAFDGVVRS
ncbi:hypothetical protein BD626DRAFT_231450 [Schizophyllum amplum]|uniref:Uncharacterized protein n=1 Tax=Schizophyllum amplum TaxID=97359 RepID=A0A550BW48_9AGAR|nr:hypothetical protein BD626DRAFT_231450 [Auriculariopsis ampla]